MEQLDQPQGVQVFDVSLLVGGGNGNSFTESYQTGLLGGVMVLKHRGVAFRQPPENEPLYQPLGQANARPTEDVQMTFIPYYAWANRSMCPMQVWVPYIRRAESAAVRR